MFSAHLNERDVTNTTKGIRQNSSTKITTCAWPKLGNQRLISSTATWCSNADGEGVAPPHLPYHERLMNLDGYASGMFTLQVATLAIRSIQTMSPRLTALSDN